MKRHNTYRYDTGHGTPNCLTQKGLHLALFSSPARSRVLQRVTIAGAPKRRQRPLVLTWLRLSGCAALVPPRWARYPVGVIQHPDDCPLTEATGLVLLLRRPKKGSGFSESRHGLSITELNLRWHHINQSMFVWGLQELRFHVYLISSTTFTLEEQKLYYPFLFCLSTKLHKDLQKVHFSKYYLISSNVKGTIRNINTSKTWSLLSRSLEFM